MFHAIRLKSEPVGQFRCLNSLFAKSKVRLIIYMSGFPG